MNRKKILMLVVAIAMTAVAGAQTRVVAHRGYWKTEGSAQNSITSLKRANDVGVYGTEFDVQLTADNRIVVNHDDSIQGYVIADTPYSKLKGLKLSNGEPLPTLEDYLQAGRACPRLQLVLEIKPHRLKDDEDRLVRQVVALVRQYGMEQHTDYISFSMNVCEQLAKEAPGASISYLRSDVAPRELKAKGITGIDYHFKALQANPEWVKEAHDLGMTVNVWTVDDLDVARQMRDLKVDFITTDRPEEMRALVAE
jgi:glycerophosphoryl diester phosphodiesterase